MLARERLAAADAVADGCTALAAALGTLPSGLLEMVANTAAALSVQSDVQRPSRAARTLSSRPEVQRPSGAAPKRERVPMRITAPDGRVRPRSVPTGILSPTVGNARFSFCCRSRNRSATGGEGRAYPSDGGTSSGGYGLAESHRKLLSAIPVRITGSRQFVQGVLRARNGCRQVQGWGAIRVSGTCYQSLCDQASVSFALATDPARGANSLVQATLVAAQ
jgi:hypothetical protein